MAGDGRRWPAMAGEVCAIATTPRRKHGLRKAQQRCHWHEPSCGGGPTGTSCRRSTRCRIAPTASASRSRSTFGVPGPTRDLRAGLGERPAYAPELLTPVAPLAPDQPEQTGPDRQVLDPHPRPLVHPPGEHPARRTGRHRLHGLHQHQPGLRPRLVLNTAHLDHPEPGQVKQHRRRAVCCFGWWAGDLERITRNN